jgi:hypothetical protein
MVCRSTGRVNECVASNTKQTKGLWEVKQAPHCVECQLLPGDRRERGVMVGMLPSGVVGAVHKSVATKYGTSRVQTIDNVFRESGTLLSYQQARHTCMCVHCTRVCGCACMHEYLHVYVHMYIFMYTCTCMHSPSQEHYVGSKKRSECRLFQRIHAPGSATACFYRRDTAQMQSSSTVCKLFLNGGAPQMGDSLASAGVDSDLFSFAGLYVCLETTRAFQEHLRPTTSPLITPAFSG